MSGLVEHDVMKLLLATGNTHKTREFAEILGPTFEVVDLRTLPPAPEVEETGATFEENAALKAEAASRRTDLLVVADDSGLEVFALGGAPGIRSARYAGPKATDAANVARLLQELHAAGATSGASGRFRCALAVARAGALLRTFHGEVNGEVVDRPQGIGGFGYDPVFIPSGFDVTFAELPPRTKNEVSHRARAIAELRKYLSSGVVGL